MCVLAPLLFNIDFVTVIPVAYTRFKADKDIMDALVHLRKNKEARGGGNMFDIVWRTLSRLHPATCSTVTGVI